MASLDVPLSSIGLFKLHSCSLVSVQTDDSIVSQWETKNDTRESFHKPQFLASRFEIGYFFYETSVVSIITFVLLSFGKGYYLSTDLF